VLNMFRTLIYPSSGACDCVVELPHRSSCSQFVVCWRFGAGGVEWCSFCRLKPAKLRYPTERTFTNTFYDSLNHVAAKMENIMDNISGYSNKTSRPIIF
jgi:hypothetical protein